MSNQKIEKNLIELTKQLLLESGTPHVIDVKLTASLAYLGIDSVSRAELFQRIEKQFAVSIPDRLLAEAETLADIANYLEKAEPVKPHVRNEKIIKHEERSFVDPTHCKTLTELLLLYGEQAPQKAHIYFQNEEGGQEIITYASLLSSSLKVAAGLKAYGLKEGETVAIMQPTHPDFFYIFFGALLAGGIPVPIYPPFRMHMLESYAKLESRILKNAEVRILVTFTEAEKLSHLIQAFVPSLKHVVTVKELMKIEEPIVPFKTKSEHFAFIQYTSGSTADPKGVLLAHHNLLANIRAYGEAIAVKPDDIAVSWLPLYHDMGLIGMWLGSLYFGIPLILLTPFSFLNHPERWLWAIHYHRGTLSGAPNFAYDLCVRKIDPALIEGLDLSSWRMAANGAEKIYPQTLQAFTKKFAPYGLKQTAMFPVYGLAESTVALALSPLNREFRLDQIQRKAFEEEKKAIPTEEKNNLTFVSCGKPIPGHEIRIVNDENQAVLERHVGNLQFRGPSSMHGYYHNPKATAEVFHDGWLDSGDLAYLADGEVFVTGRRKDLIIKAGRNLYPAEIEELVGVVKGVRQGCVAAFSTNELKREGKKRDAASGEFLIIVAETREANKQKKAELLAKIKETVAMNLDIAADDIVLVPPHIVPKTSSGKLQRAACKKMYLEGRLTKKQPAWMQVTRLALQWFLQKSWLAIKGLSKLLYSLYLAVILFFILPIMYCMLRFSKQETALKSLRFFAKFLIKAAFCRLTIKGLDRINTSPLVFTANHASYVDALVLLTFLPYNTRFVAKKELFTTPILRTVMHKLDCIPVDRMDFSKGVQDTLVIEETLKAGHSILIFPEGTFGYASGLRPFRLGAFKIAAETNTPVCPIALKGTRTILRAEEKLLSPGSIEVTIGNPIHAKGTEWHDVTQLRNEVRLQIADHCGEPSLDLIVAQTVAPRR